MEHVHQDPGPFNFTGYFPGAIRIGDLQLGGGHPLRIQSMTNTDTRDVEATLKQVMALADAGCEMVRISAPNQQAAKALGKLRDKLRNVGYKLPLVADIHFLPEVALTASRLVDKVRINPGNFIPEGREGEDMRDDALKNLRPLVESCMDHGTAIRIGVNHGSLSKRILERYGNTPKGMVVSLLEYLEVFEVLGFHELALSLKASNPEVCVHANRLLANSLISRGTPYPLHLGVTEAGSGEEGMMNSIAGIGTLLEDGLGDTIRVSLTGNPLREIPLAKQIREWYSSKPGPGTGSYAWEPLRHYRRESEETGSLGGEQPPQVILDKEGKAINGIAGGTLTHDGAMDARGVIRFGTEVCERGDYVKVTLRDRDDVPLARKVISNLIESGEKRPVLLHTEGIKEPFAMACLVSPFLIDGLADGVILDEPGLVTPMFTLLQTTRRRVTRTTYIACPSCARTTFDIEKALEEVKARTSHLNSLTIAVMGCIVNGPGEMAGADYGYVGAGPGKVNLYKGNVVVAKNVPETEAVERLVGLIDDL